MKTHILALLLVGATLCACHHSLPIQPVAPAAPAVSEYSAALWDFFQVGSHNVIPGNRNFMQPGSVVSGGDFSIGPVQFTAGLVDFDGDGRFNEVGDDRIFLTIYKNRQVRFNNGYGTPLAPVSINDNILQVDGHCFRVSFAAEDGKRMSLQPVAQPAPGAEILKMETTLPPDVDMKDQLGHTVRLHDLLDGKKQLYLAFWAMPVTPMEFDKYPARYLREVHDLYGDSVRVVAIQYTGLDDPSLYKLNSDFYFRMIGQPWLSLQCEDPRLFNRLQQDMTYCQGILMDKNGRYRELYLRWREMAEQFPYMR